MVWEITDLFPQWGDSGEQPPVNKDYEGGEQVLEAHLDYLWHSLGTLESEARAALADIDSDADGRVDAADTTALLKGNDIDTNDDGVVNNADNVTETYRDTDLDTEYHTSTTVDSLNPNESKYLTQRRLSDGVTLSLFNISLHATDGSAVDAAIEIVSISNGTTTVESTIASSETTNGTASYTNTTGGEQIIGVRLHNTGTAESPYTATVTTRI